ncbi:VOC family protein [bacterium]|nr:VOC family protein [bacterium]
MRNCLFFTLAFGLGFLAHSSAENSARVTGIGGVFFESQNPEALKSWYEKQLGIKMDDHGHMFEWKTLDAKSGVTQWSVMRAGNKYLQPSKSHFMINYRVEHLKELVEHLKANRVKVLDAIEVTPYGDFVHILDADGNKVELWQPPAE